MNFTAVTCPKPGQVRSVKLSGRYHGVARCPKTGATLVSEESYDSPLKAANSARKYTKVALQKEKGQTRKLNNAKVTKTAKTPTKRVLLAEHEMTQHNTLRFREVWLVRGVKEGDYVKTALDKDRKILVDYTKNRGEAKVFKSYEEADTLRKTYKALFLGHHSVQKFFLDTENE